MKECITNSLAATVMGHLVWDLIKDTFIKNVTHRTVDKIILSQGYSKARRPPIAEWREVEYSGLSLSNVNNVVPMTVRASRSGAERSEVKRRHMHPLRSALP